MNLSHVINPFLYDNTPPIEVIVLECTRCDRRGKKRLPHATTNTAIMTQHFKGWRAKGYRGQKHTLCPTCANTGSQTCAEDKP